MKTIFTKPFYITCNERQKINCLNPILVLDLLNEQLKFKDKEGDNQVKWFEQFFHNFFQKASLSQLERIYLLLTPEGQRYIEDYSKDKRRGFYQLIVNNKGKEVKKYLVYLYLRHIFS